MVSVAVELRFVLWEVSGSNHNRNTSYTTVFSGLPQCLQVKLRHQFTTASVSQQISRTIFFLFCCVDFTAHCDAENCGSVNLFQIRASMREKAKQHFVGP